MPMPTASPAPIPSMRCAMSKLHHLAVPALALLLAGCATPVPQALPQPLVPKTFVGPVPADAHTWPDANWWQGFGDADLTALIAKAQADNRDMAAAAARVMQAEAQSTIQRSALFPQIGAQGNHINGGCQGQACQNFAPVKAFGLSFNASYELDFWGLARDNLRAANEQLKSARFAQQCIPAQGAGLGNRRFHRDGVQWRRIRAGRQRHHPRHGAGCRQ